MQARPSALAVTSKIFPAEPSDTIVLPALAFLEFDYDPRFSFISVGDPAKTFDHFCTQADLIVSFQLSVNASGGDERTSRDWERWSGW